MKNSKAQNTLESMSQAVWYNQWTLSKFRKYLTGDILEVGCGIGNFTYDLTKFGKVWAIDINKEYVAKTEQKVDGKAQVGLGDIEKGEYFFNDRKFDIIICLNVLEHIRDDQSVLNNLFRLLKPEGMLILLIPAHQFLYGAIDSSIDHFRRYDKSEINNRLKKVGFSIIKSRRLNFLGAIGWLINGRIFKKNTIDDTKIKIFNIIAPLILPLENLIEPPFGTSILVIAKKGINK